VGNHSNDNDALGWGEREGAKRRYRVVLSLSHTPKGPWRDSEAEALQDAVEADLAEDDDGEILLDQFAMIEIE
jgi:hypothetical protein